MMSSQKSTVIRNIPFILILQMSKCLHRWSQKGTDLLLFLRKGGSINFWAHNNFCCSVKNFFQSPLRFCRTFNILDGINLLCHINPLCLCDWSHSLGLEMCNNVRLFSQVYLVPYQDDGYTWTVMQYLWIPFMVDVFKRAGANNREASQEDICLWVGEGSQTIIVLLACSVPEVQADKLSTNAQVFRVVVKPVWMHGCV